MKKMAMFVMMVVAMVITAMAPMTAKANYEDYLTDFERWEAIGDEVDENDMRYIADIMLGDLTYVVKYKGTRYAYAPYSKSYKAVFINEETGKCVIGYTGMFKDGKWYYWYISEVTDIPEDVKAIYED